MKINFTIKKYKVILIVVVAVILGGGIMLSRPIVKEVTPRSCTDILQEREYSRKCDQDGNVLYWELDGVVSSSNLGMYKKDFSLTVLKNRLHFIFKKYMLSVEDKDLLDSITQIKVVNQEQYGGQIY